MIELPRDDSMQLAVDELGRLEFTISQPIECSFRFSSWEQGLEYERFEDGTWQHESLDCGFPLLSLSELQYDEPSVQRFISRIPAEVRLRAAPFKIAQTTMLGWIARDQHAAELFESEPTLLWLLINRQQMHDWPEQHVEALLKQPRTQVLSAISGVSQRSGLKWLARIELDDGQGGECAALINGLRIGLHQSRWAQEEPIPIHWIVAATRHPEISNSRAFHAYCRQYPEDSSAFNRHLSHHARFWVDALNVARVIQIADAEVALHRCNDFGAVRRLHDRWTDRLNQQKALVVEGKTPFPPPPFEGTDSIHPIKTREDLLAEGRLMHHCVAVYESRIETGQCYIYRILEPERATIELRFAGDQVRVGQVALAYNGRPSAETIDAVIQWMLKVNGPATKSASNDG